MWLQSTLVHWIPSNKGWSILAAIAFISYWQLCRQLFSRTPFLKEHINKRLTIIQIVKIVYNSKQRKTKKFNRAFDQYQDCFFDLKLKIQIHHIKALIHSRLLLLKQQTQECKRKCILYQFWNTFAEYFWNIGSKIWSFVKYLLWYQNYFGMHYPFLHQRGFNIHLVFCYGQEHSKCRNNVVLECCEGS